MKSSNLQDFLNLIKVITQQWELLKEDLYNGKTEGQSIEEIKSNYLFLNRFDQVLEGTVPSFDINLKEIGTMYRGVGINEKIALDNYSRLIPSLEHAKYHNRMNPPGTAFIYLGISPTKGQRFEDEKKTVLETVEAELRAIKGDYYTKARFEANSSIKIFDMTGNPELPRDFSEFAKVTINNFLNLPLLMAQYYFNLFNHENIFKPIKINDQEEKAREYAPFQLLAKYIQGKGYGGIKFRSTVHESGMNLVVFNVNDVKLIESTMERIKI